MKTGDHFASYTPFKDGIPWLAGTGESLQEAMSSVQCLEGCLSWQECEKEGWKIIATKTTIR